MSLVKYGIRYTEYGRHKDKVTLTLFEFTVSLLIIIIFLAVFGVFISRVAHTAKEVSLQSELTAFREAIALYKALKGNNPGTLQELMHAEYRPQGLNKIIFGKEFLNIVGKDKDGYPLDPFGRKFFYNAERGVIHSQTKGYEKW
jgi:type II secretory pathway pseudopilin PulG